MRANSAVIRRVASWAFIEFADCNERQARWVPESAAPPFCVEALVDIEFHFTHGAKVAPSAARSGFRWAS